MKALLSVVMAITAVLPLAAAQIAVSSGGAELCKADGSLEFTLPMPSYELIPLDGGETGILMQGASYAKQPGYPQLPMVTYTFALPPGSVLQNAQFLGNRTPVDGRYVIEASLPDMPLSASRELGQRLYSLYEETKAQVYSGSEILPDKFGEIRSSGEMREYSLVTVACCPFYYDPVSRELSYASDVKVRISYSPASSEHQRFISRFLETGTLNPDVPEHIYNKSDARGWYRPSERLLAKPRMLILTTNALKDSIGRYSYWRASTGFDVTIKTKEEVLASSSGADPAQKIRNWLRTNAADYDYLFLIGFVSELPMRTLTPFINNDPGPYYDEPDITPNPSDIYYGDLSLPDDQSWDKDKDGFYGEMLASSGFPNPQDAPDLNMELHVGRINNSYPAVVSSILEKIWLFEHSTNTTYKEASVLAGGILWYSDWNGSGVAGFDGAYYMEYLMDNGVVKKSSATTLYEGEGLRPSVYTSDVSFTQANLKSTLKNTDAGIFVENNHGWKNSFVRCVWRTDSDGDGSPDDPEFDWPNGLTNGDAFLLNSENPNVAFLLSCLNGYPEDINSLAQALLNNGSAAVVAHTRSAFGRQGWDSPADGGQNGLYYYVLENYLKNAATYDYVLGDAVDAGRLHYYETESAAASRYLNTYEHIIFGDPAMRHMGRSGTIPPLEGISEGIEPMLARVTLSVNPDHSVGFSLAQSGEVRIEVWDVAGRRLQILSQGSMDAGEYSLKWDTESLASGTYFVTLRTAQETRVAKAVLVK